MNNDKTVKKCCTCQTVKPLEAYSKDKSRKDGLDVRCRKCYSARDKERYLRLKDTPAYRERKRASSKRHKDLYPERQKARSIARRVLDPKPSCEQCGSTTKLHLHHPDYSRPLEVVTLCMTCHEELHHGVLV